MTVLITHNLIWLKPHAGKAAGQPLSFKEKTQLARLRRLAFKGIVGKAEDHPELVKVYQESLTKAEPKKEEAPKVEAAPEVKEETIEEPKVEETIEEVLELEEVEEPKVEETPAPKKGKKSKKNRG